MKIFLTAIAMTFAGPAAAQTANPAANPHAGHAQHADHGKMDHSKMDHGKHGEGHKGCCDHKMADGRKMDCCDKAKGSAGKMDCCGEHAKNGASAGGHAGHDMSKN